MNEAPFFQPNRPTPSFVRAGENILWYGKPTMAVLFSQAVGFAVTLIVMAVFILGGSSTGSFFLVGGPVVLVTIFLVVILLNALRLRRTEYVVTRQSIYTRSGIIGHTVFQTTYEKITDIALKQEILGRLLNYASLHVNTAGSNMAPVRMEGLRDAYQVKEMIEHNREMFLAQGRGASAPPASAIPRFVPEHELMHLTCPTTRKPFKRPRWEAGRRVPCPHCGRTHLVSKGRSNVGRARPA